MKLKNWLLTGGIVASSLLLKTQTVEAQVRGGNSKPTTTINTGQKKLIDEKQQKENQVKADLVKYLGDDYDRLTQAGFKDFNVYITQDDKGAATLNIYTKKNATSSSINAEKDTIVVESMAGFTTSYSIGSQNDKFDLSNTKRLDCIFDIASSTTKNKWLKSQTNATYRILGDNKSAGFELKQTKDSFGQYEFAKANVKQDMQTDDNAVIEMKKAFLKEAGNLKAVTDENLVAALVKKFNEKNQEKFLKQQSPKQKPAKPLTPEQLKKDSLTKVDMNKQINLELFNGDGKKSEKYRNAVMKEYASKITDTAFLKRVFGDEEYKRISQIPGIKWASKVQPTNNAKEYGSALQLVVDAYVIRVTHEGKIANAVDISKVITDGVVGDADNPPDGIFGDLDYLQAKTVYTENQTKLNPTTNNYESTQSLWMVTSSREYDFTTTNKLWSSAVNHVRVDFNKNTSQFELRKKPGAEQVKQGAPNAYMPVENGDYQPFGKLEAMQQEGRIIYWNHIDKFVETNELSPDSPSDFAIGVHLSTDGEPKPEVVLPSAVTKPAVIKKPKGARP